LLLPDLFGRDTHKQNHPVLKVFFQKKRIQLSCSFVSSVVSEGANPALANYVY